MKVQEIIDLLMEDYSLEDDIEVKEVFLLKNGVVAVFDSKGQQIGFLQGLLKTGQFKVQ